MESKRFTLLPIFVIVFVISFSCRLSEDKEVNRRQLFDDNWRFVKDDPQGAENPSFDDSEWRTLDLPHDWSIEDLPNQIPDSIIGPFSKASQAKMRTGYTIGRTAWYRKSFTIDKMDEHKIAEKKLKFSNKLEVKNLSFRYNENLPKILNNVSITINKGEKITIKGQTGSGKSTLVNIISGLLDPLEGKIIVDDKEINSLNKNSWQRNFAIVPQTVFLSDSSILENIAIGYELDEINLEKAKQVAKIAQIDSFIEKLPNQYYQKVGERGVRLSGGQRQRIGIARALYRDASIVILDEPTNALDKETENLVMDSISSLGKDITLIMISHSNNLLQYFDQVIDLDKIK